MQHGEETDKRIMTIGVTTHEALAREDIDYWRSKTPEERLDMVELLRLEAGKSLYEYPAPFQSVLEVIDGAAYQRNHRRV